MPRRERSSIVGGILDALSRSASEGNPKLTHVALRCNLPYDRFRDYVADMQRRGLLDPENPFRLTPAGRELLQSYRAWREALRLFGMDPEA